MTVPLIEGSSGSARSDSGSTEHTSLSASTSTSGGARSSTGRDLVTVHVGNGVTLSQDDLEMLLVLVQTLVVIGWAYHEVTNS